MKNQQQLEKYLDTKEAFLDKFIGNGTDHELFITSYIHGHFSVVAAKTMQHTPLFEDADQAFVFFTEHLQQSIFDAIEKGELESQDAKDVTTMLKQLAAET